MQCPPADVTANPASAYDSLLENEPGLHFELPPHLAGANRMARDPFDGLLSGPAGAGAALSTNSGTAREPGYVLNPTERAALRSELEGQLTRGVLANGATQSSVIQPLTMGGERDIRNFYADAMRGGQRALDFSFTIGAAESGGYGRPATRQLSEQQRAARAEMEAVGQELLRPALQARLLLQDATQELRRFILMQEPLTAQMMMMDGASGHGLVMSIAATEEPQDKQRERTATRRPPVDSAMATPRHRVREAEERPPLGILLWRILTDRLAFVLYGLIGLCWAAWRYVISRYA